MAIGTQLEGGADGVVRREARASGVRVRGMPSLDAVERRRTELLVTALVVLVASGVGATLSVWASALGLAALPVGAIRVGLGLIVVAFTAYVVEKELHLRRLSRLLQEQQLLNVALQNRIREQSAMVSLAKQVDAAETLTELLDAILTEALRLVPAAGAAVLLPDRDGVPRTAGLRGDVPGRVGEPALRVMEAPTTSSFPLVSRDREIGRLVVVRHPDRPLDPYDERVLVLFGVQAGIWITGHLARDPALR